jgi:UDP-N-acetylglucosamine:LPS N-acetylglucosamine transferase
VQEADWTAVGTHDSHHIFERLSVDGHKIIVINHEYRWRREKRDKKLISKRNDFRVSRVIDKANVTVITPTYVRIPILDYISVILSHRYEIRSQIKNFTPDVIIGLGLFNSAYACKIAKKNGIPYVYYILDEIHRLIPIKYLSPIAKIIESATIKNSDMVIVTSVALAKYVKSMGAMEDRIQLAPHGYSTHTEKISSRGSIRERIGVDEKILSCFSWDGYMIFLDWWN